MGEALISRASGSSGGSGSDINVVQTRGASTTDVMSQKAVSENMCFGKNSTSSSTDNITIGEGASSTATHQTGQVLPSITIGHGASSDLECISIGVDASSSEGGISIGSSASSTKWGVSIGQSAQNTTDYGVAIGMGALASAKSSVAIGKNSKATQENVISVGDLDGMAGLRRIVNVADPVNLEDAVNRNYLRDLLDSGGEGEWTPTLKCGLDGGGYTTPPSYTTTLAYGYYKCIGDLVFISFRGEWTLSDVGSGTAIVGGLPFEAKGTSTEHRYGLSIIEAIGLSRQGGVGVIYGGDDDIKLFTSNGETAQRFYTDEPLKLAYSGFYLREIEY